MWEENEFWIELSVRMDPDGSLGIRQWFESPYRPGELITVDEYYHWIFENSVPGLPEAAAKEGLTPWPTCASMGPSRSSGQLHTVCPAGATLGCSNGHDVTSKTACVEDGKAVGVMVDGEAGSASTRPAASWSSSARPCTDWGWPEKEYTIPWPLKSHVHPDNIDREKGEMLLLPNFRLPTLDPHPQRQRQVALRDQPQEPGVDAPVRCPAPGRGHAAIWCGSTTEIGYFVDKVWVTEGIKPGVIAMSHHLGRWRLQDGQGVNPGMSAPGRA